MRVSRFVRCTWIATAVALAPAIAAPPAASAQSQRTAAKRLRPSASPLERVISISFTDVTLDEALQRIARQGKVPIAYSRSRAPLEKRVTLRADGIAVGEALADVLRGTNLEPYASPGGQIAIVAAEPKPRPPVPVLPLQQGTVTGRVTSAETGEALSGVTVSLEGTGRGTLTDADGRYRLEDVPAGSYTLVAASIGFARQTREVTVVADQVVTADFVLETSAVNLDELVVTVTGPQRRREVGNVVATIDVDDVVGTAPVTSFSDVISGRVPGVQVFLNGGLTGASPQINIRGLSSAELSSQPLLMVDGVRIENSAAQSITTGSRAILAGRFNDLVPEDIASIEIVKGPSAATLYGTDAANGVIVVTTKRGSEGPPRWNAYAEAGAITFDVDRIRDNYFSWGHTLDGTNQTVRCVLLQAAAGTCMQDSLTTFNPLKHPETTPIGTGHRQAYGVQVSGGSDRISYFLSGGYDQEVGYLKLPQADREFFEALRGGVGLLEEELHPNAVEKYSLRANLTTQLASTAELTVSTSFITQDSRIPETGALTNGFLSTGIRDENDGYAFGNRPGDLFLPRHNEELTRFTGSASSNWRPLDWLSTRAEAGIDFSSTYFDFLRLKGENINPFYESGLRRNTKTNVLLYSADVGATATFDLSRTLTSNTSVGLQYNHRRALASTVTAEQLTPGAETVAGGAILSGSESTVESIIAGAYVQQMLGLNDRLFLTAAVRADGGSTFGSDFDTALYPKASISWLLSEEPFWPNLPGVTSLRLRGAYGASGVQPSSIAALARESFSPVMVDGELTTGATLRALGNADLKPERQREFEGGIDGAFLDGRLAIEATYYDKKSTDALVDVSLPYSIGGGSRTENVGSVRNWGYEALVTARVFDRPALSWEISLNGSINHNELLTLGPNFTPSYGQFAITSIVPGYPIYSFFDFPILGYEDSNGNGIIEVAEVNVGDTPEYSGSSYPESQFTASSTLSLFEDRLAVNAQLDYRGGFLLVNRPRSMTCYFLGSCRAAADPIMMASEQEQRQDRLTSTRLGASWCIVLLLLMLGGCSDLTSVEAPDVTEPESLDNPAGALARQAGAIGSFADAFSRQTFFSGLITDEFSELQFVFDADRRTITASVSGLTYPYPYLSDARINALRAIQSLQLHNPTPPSRIGELYAFGGYVELIFAENLCSGVPLGSVIDGLPVIGPTLTREELISRALAHFDSAVAFAGDDVSITNLARVGRGRTLLYSGDAAAAAAAVAGVPTDFVYRIEYSEAGQNNRLYAEFDDRSISVSDREGSNGLAFVSANDPRLVTRAMEPDPDHEQTYNFVGNESLSSPIVLASGIEAALIRAEAALQAGDVAEWADILNILRQTATSPSVSPLPADSTTLASPAVRLDVTLRERAFWLFGTGHRQGDLRRLIRNYGRSTESVFPTGEFRDTGMQYGEDVTFVPFGEQRNPNYSGCFDRNP